MSTAHPPDHVGQKSARLVPLVRPGQPPRVELPLPLTSFVGREREVASARAVLRRDGVRLLTLIGPGGVGKTRLALRVAEEVADDFPDGVWFVPLASVHDPALVAAAVAGVIGVREAGGRSLLAGLQAFLREKRALLLLDNFEHVLETAPLATDLLATCPHLVVLATSRAVLHLSGEHDLVVPPLALPDLDRLPSLDGLNESPAVRLFVERARAARDGFALSADNAGAVVQICHRLDGLPLAIELAAARSSVLPPAVLLSRLGQRLPLLTGGPRDAPARLQTMREAISWSHDLLDDDERMLFRRLAVFVGGCSFDAAAAVYGESIDDSVHDLIASLVDKSLLRSLAMPAGETDAATYRVGMLETIREYGSEQLEASGEAAVIGERHAGYLLALAEAAEPLLRGPDQIAWLARLEAELPNLRAALAWLRDARDTVRGIRLASALWTFWVVRGYVPEGRRWLETFLGAEPVGSVGRLTGLVALADLVQRQGDHPAATAWIEEALYLAREVGDRSGESVALRGLGSIVISRAMAALYGLGDAAVAEVEFARAEDCLVQGLALARELGDAWGAARALTWLTGARLGRGDSAGAAVSCEEAEAAFRRLGDPWQLSQAVANAGVLADTAGDFPRARAAFAEALALAQQLGYRWFSGWCLVGLAAVAAGGEEHERAARLLGTAAVLREAAGEPLRRSDQAWHDRTTAAARRALGEAGFAAAWAAGGALLPDAAIAEALAWATATAERSPEPAAPATHGRLTPREVDVLRLVAEGQSDREIAAALGLSYRTVTNHVTSILTKLDVPSRAAAAADAVRRGLA